MGIMTVVMAMGMAMGMATTIKANMDTNLILILNEFFTTSLMSSVQVL